MFNKKKSCSVSKLPLDALPSSPCGSTENVTFRKTEPSVHTNPFLGIFYTLLTSIFITLTSVFVKKIKYINPGYLSLVRNAGVFAGCLPIAIYKVREIIGPKKERVLLLVRGFLGATALYLNLTAYRFLPLAEAAVMMSSLPALTTILACIFLKEACTKVQGTAVVMTIFGVILSVRLPELIKNRSGTQINVTYIVGLASALGCVVFLSISLVSLRKMKDIHFSVPLLYFGVIGMLENATISFSTSTFVYPNCGWDVVETTLIGVFGFLGHCTLTLAVQSEAVSIVSVMKASFDIIVAMVFQVIFFSEIPDAYNIGGAFIVMLAVSAMGVRNWLFTLPEESKARKRLRFLLL